MNQLSLGLAVILLFTSTAAQAAETTAVAQATETTGQPGPALQQVARGQDNPGFFERYFPFSLNRNLTPEVDDIVLVTILFNIFLPFGALWGPLVLLDDPPRLDSDIALAYVVPGLLVTTALSLILCPAFCITYYWNTPVAVLNAWDRAYKTSYEEPRPRRKKRKKQRKKEPEWEEDWDGDEGYQEYEETSATVVYAY